MCNSLLILWNSHTLPSPGCDVRERGGGSSGRGRVSPRVRGHGTVHSAVRACVECAAVPSEAEGPERASAERATFDVTCHVSPHGFSGSIISLSLRLTASDASINLGDPEVEMYTVVLSTCRPHIDARVVHLGRH